jgi:predicted KAP-like P-loop ATPase
VYFSGMDHFIITPRHVIRLINVLQATYSSVMGEVNTVDFIAIEAIRVFMPKLYDEMRSNQDILSGVSTESGRENTAEQRRKVFETTPQLAARGCAAAI